MATLPRIAHPRMLNWRSMWHWCAGVVFLLGLGLAEGARADTIVLKNGRRIVGETVTQEEGKVICETAAGIITIPESLVARIEKDNLGANVYPESKYSQPNPAAAGISIAPPAPADNSEMAEIAAEVSHAVVHDGAIDSAALGRFEAGAANGRPEMVGRAVTADLAAGQFALSQGDSSAALEHSERALAFAPGQAALLLNVAYVHLRRGEYKDALEVLERVRPGAGTSDATDLAKLTGWADYGLNRLDQAVAQWRRALQLRPDPDVTEAFEKAERDLEAERDFRESESAHFILKYNGSAAPELARAVLAVLEDDFQAIASALDFAPKEPIGVILYTSETFGDITRAPNWVGALNDGRIRIPVQGLTAVTPELARVLKHELTHSFITEKTHGRSPVWLQEGVAQWMEGKRSADAAAMLVALYNRQQDPSLPLLEASWLGLPNEVAGVAYAWSLAVVETIIDGASTGLPNGSPAGSSGGPPLGSSGSSGDLSNVNRLLDRVAVQATAEGALRASQQMDYPELTRATAEYLRHAYLHQQ